MARTSTRFHELHAQAHPLILPNVWDAASARILMLAGARAVATSSAAVSWSLGFADGGRLPPDLLESTVAHISRGLGIPLSVDVEDGLYISPERAADFVEALADAGAAGINIEDGVAAPEHLATSISHIRERGRSTKLFINARTDVVLRSLVEPEQVVEEVLRRAANYAEAGADALFVPGLTDRIAIKTIVDRCSLPLNLMWCPGLPSVPELAQLGVRRVSAGPSHFLAVYSRLLELGRSFMDAPSTPTADAPLDYAAMNALF